MGHSGAAARETPSLMIRDDLESLHSGRPAKARSDQGRDVGGLEIFGNNSSGMEECSLSDSCDLAVFFPVRGQRSKEDACFPEASHPPSLERLVRSVAD